MGIFSHLFERKNCALCGKAAGPEAREIKEGLLCKSCVKKLSPWYDFRPQPGVEDLRRQIDYRQKQFERYASFSPSLRFKGEGEGLRELRVDETLSCFGVFGVKDKKTDLLSLDDVKRVSLEVNETWKENKDGDRGWFEYRFFLCIYVMHPFFRVMRFRLHRGPIELNAPLTEQELEETPEIARQRNRRERCKAIYELAAKMAVTLRKGLYLEWNAAI